MSSMEALQEPSTPAEPESLAPGWHTAALIGLMVAVAVTGTWLSRHGGAPIQAEPPTSRVAAVYLPLLVVNFTLLVYVCRVGRPRNALRDLIGRRYRTRARAIADLALAFAAFLIIEAIELSFAHLFGSGRPASTSQILPHFSSERLAWLFVAASVGFCEEVVYRGYLRTQLAAFTRSMPLAVVLQGLLFGIAHGEQGLAIATRVAVYGVGLGGLAAWRRSLLPGILCHVALDLTSGLGASV